MNVKVTPLTFDSPFISNVENLYFSAFPASERMPIIKLYDMYREKKTEWLIVHDDDKFVGFAYLFTFGEIVYLCFLATDPSVRGGGYGSEVMKQLLSYYGDKTILGTIESTHVEADNHEQRARRLDFYLRNGMYEIISAIEAPSLTGTGMMTYDIISSRKDFTKEQFAEFIEAVLPAMMPDMKVDLK